MKSSFLLMAFIGLLFFSCTKTEGTISTDLDGTWKMVLVKDNTTNAQQTKPSSIQGNVILTIVTNSSTSGSFTGRTPTNEIFENEYTYRPDWTIGIPVLNMTKISETSWGSEFVDNIRDAQQYSFASGEKLNIRTTRKTLVFEKQ